MAKLIYTPEAKLEIKKAAAYYEGCKAGLGQAFLDASKKLTFLQKVSFFFRRTNANLLKEGQRFQGQLESAICGLAQSPFRQ